jgi:hypothetical protein
VRFFQAWLEPALEGIGAECMNRRSQLVRYLVNPVLAAVPIKKHALAGNH